jgi:ADP-ribosylglycohydrolase
VKRNLPPDHAARLQRARVALEGLSVGDALGECFLRRARHLPNATCRLAPPPPWPTTDDTEMALSILSVLETHGRVDQDALAQAFARRHDDDPGRGYGRTAHAVLDAILAGQPWTDAARAPFGGSGSMGNGGAMRVAPLGGYFADDLDAVVEQARLSAQVTHWNPDGQAGAMAVAVAAALAWQGRGTPLDPAAFLATVHGRTPPSPTQDGLHRARSLPLATKPADAAAVLGSGERVLSWDTVPYVVWCAVRSPDDFAAALWSTMEGGGDMDTTCAMVGGILALRLGVEAIPPAWVEAREPLRFTP